MREFIKKEIRPRTEAICLAGLVDSDLVKLCTEFSNAISKPASAGGALLHVWLVGKVFAYRVFSG